MEKNSNHYGANVITAAIDLDSAVERDEDGVNAVPEVKEAIERLREAVKAFLDYQAPFSGAGR